MPPLAANVLERSTPTPSVPATAGFAAVRRSRVVRDFVLLITLCSAIGLAVGLAMMAAVFALV